MSDTALDRKLHRIVLSTTPDCATSASLARHIESKNCKEFVYFRDNKQQPCKWHSISRYVSFAGEIGLLDETFACIVGKTSVRAFGSFKPWAGERILAFNIKNGLSQDALQSAVLALVQEQRQVPTTQKL